MPKAVALTPAGDVLIADEQNNRIRFVGTVVAPANTTPPTVPGTPVAGQTADRDRGRLERNRAADLATSGSDAIPACARHRRRRRPRPTRPSRPTSASTLRVGVTGTNPAGSATAYSAQTASVNGAVAPADEHLATRRSRASPRTGRR